MHTIHPHRITLVAAASLLACAGALAGNVRYTATTIDYSAQGYSFVIPTAINDNGLLAGTLLSTSGSLTLFRA